MALWGAAGDHGCFCSPLNRNHAGGSHSDRDIRTGDRSRPNAPSLAKVIRQVACVSAGVGQFRISVGELAEGIIGPSQWEHGVNDRVLIGPSSDEFVSDFTSSFGQSPDYVAAGAFAAGLIIEECIRRAGSLNDLSLRDAAHDLETETFYGKFQLDRCGRQIGHSTHLVRWQNGRKVVLT